LSFSYTIINTASNGMHLVTLFGSLRYVELKLKEVTGEREAKESPWHYDYARPVMTEREAYRNIDHQIASSAKHNNPQYANVASAQLMACFGGLGGVVAGSATTAADDDCGLPLITTPPAGDGLPPVKSAWAGDW
jgi:hypothetical protein